MGVVDGDILIFRLTSHQKRVQRIAAAIVPVAAAGLLAGGVAARDDPIGDVLIGIAAILLLATWTILANLRATTECDPTGLRGRTAFGRLRKAPWSQVTGISVNPLPRSGLRAVTVTTTKGHQFRLTVPSESGQAPGEFNATAQQIIKYWHAHRCADVPAGGVRVAAINKRSPGLRVLRAALILFVSVNAILVFAGTTFETVQAYAVHFDLGESGSFSSVSEDCSHTGTCMWTGTFTGANGGTQYGVTFEDGGHQGTAGAVDVPAAYLWGSAYPAGGGSDWVAYSLFELLELVALYFCVRFWRRRRGRRRTATSSPPVPLPSPPAPGPSRGTTRAAELIPAARRSQASGRE
jgi:hypothetical protein